MKTTTRNIIIIRGDATSVTFQTDKSFPDLCREIKRMQEDGFYRLSQANMVYVADINSPADNKPASYSIGEMIREVS